MSFLSRILSALKGILRVRHVTYETYETQSLTVDATAGGVRIDEAKINTSTVRVFATLETAQIRFQLQNVVVLTAGGTEGSPLLEIGDNLTILGHDEIVNTRFIRTGASSGTLQVLLQREVKA